MKTVTKKERIDIIPGTISGGKKAAATNKARWGEDYYQRLGKIGGKAGGVKGFALNRELARAAGRKGGRISRRGPKTHCTFGHELNGDNLLLDTRTRAKRCVKCLTYQQMQSVEAA